MLNIPEEIKELYRQDNIREPATKTVEINFYSGKIETLYPANDLYPSDDLFPAEHGIPWLTITSDKIVSESFRLTESLCSNNDLAYGACEAAQMEFTCADIEEVMAGQEFVASIEAGGYKMTLGTYVVQSVERQVDRRFRKVTAYDRMIRFDMDVAVWYHEFFVDQKIHTLKEFRNSLCGYFGVEQVQADLVNDGMIVEKTVNPEQMGGRSVLKAICEINGVFGHFDRAGALKYVSLKNTGLYPSEDLHPSDDLFPSDADGFERIDYYRSVEYEDYLVNGIDRLEIRDEGGLIGTDIGMGQNGYIIEGNFLVYGKNASELHTIAQNIYDHIGNRIYRPHRTQCNGRPYVEVGDGLTIATLNETIQSFVFARTLSGIQALKDIYEADGNEYRKEVFGVNKEITQLKGKTAVIKKQVDEVSVNLKDLAEETEAQFKVTAEQIELKVSKGEVSSQLSVESDKVTITGNRLIVDSTNFKLDGEGNAKFTGEIAGGTINIGKGNFVVGSDGKAKMFGAEFNGVINGVTINGATMVTGEQIVARDILQGNRCNLEEISAREITCAKDIHCGELYVTDSWWGGWSLTEEIKLLHDRVFGN